MKLCKIVDELENEYNYVGNIIKEFCKVINDFIFLEGVCGIYWFVY